MRTAFAITASTFHRLLARFAYAIVAAAIAGVWLVYLSHGSDTTDSLLVLLAIGFLYAFGRGFTWVQVNRAGIIGPVRAFGPRFKFEWSTPVVLRGGAYLGLSGTRIVSSESKASVFVPNEILESPEFAVAIKQFAPPEHPLARRGRGAA